LNDCRSECATNFNVCNNNSDELSSHERNKSATMIATIVFALLAVAAVNGAQQQTHGHWTLVEDVAPSDWITLQVALKHSESAVSQLKRTADAVADPDSPAYGKHMTHEQLSELMAPPIASQRIVAEWLQRQVKATDVAFVAHRDVISCRVPRVIAEKVFGVEMRVWRNHVGRHITRSLARHVVPEAIAPHVDLVLGLSDFSMLRRRGVARPPALSAAAVSASPVPASTNNAATPSTQPSISVVYSRGGASIFVDIDMRCPDGSLPTTLPPCASTDPAVVISVSAQLPYATYPAPINGYSNANISRSCRLPSQQGAAVTCTIELQSQYYQPATNITATISFASGATLVASSPFPAVATPPVLPQALRTLYSVPTNAYVVGGATQAVVEFEQQYYTNDDLVQYFKAVGVPPANAQLISVIGPNNQSNAGGEAALDIELICALAPGAKTTFWSIGANSSIEIDDILKWAIAMSNDTSPPQVSSISYGMTEEHVDRYLGNGYLRRSDIEFAKLAARGLTVVIASGDTGAGDLGPPPMSSPTCKTLHPDWPSQSPYVLSVGSTYISPLDAPACYGGIDCSQQPLGEVAVSMDQGLFWTTGGGASNTQPIPSYQQWAVNQYRASGVAFPPAAMWNSTGRMYPDVVAVGHNLEIVLQGVFQPVDGTSASAPIFSAIITLLNDHRLRVGKSPLGWINPVLYKLARVNRSSFNPVTVGNNRCGAYPGGDFPQSQECCTHGYNAYETFSAVGGLGSPNYASLLQAVLNLP
jgi:subtilase family serine protease